MTETTRLKIFQKILMFLNVRAKSFQLRQNIKALFRRLIKNSFQMRMKHFSLTEPILT